MLRAALIGENISRSRLSRALGVLCDAAGMQLDFKIVDIVDRLEFDFEAEVENLRHDGLDGVTVTHPVKTNADACADVRDGYPETLGASNLIRFEGATSRCFNTDFTGFTAAWKANFADRPPGQVAMAGAGGVARALAAGLIELGADEVCIWDTDPKAAAALVDQLDPSGRCLRAVDFDKRDRSIAVANGLVNATPLGMAEHAGSAFEAAQIGGQSWAFDAVYTPLNTVFLQDARTAGLATLSGFELFKHMAVRSFAAYTGLPVDATAADDLDFLSEGL